MGEGAGTGEQTLLSRAPERTEKSAIRWSGSGDLPHASKHARTYSTHARLLKIFKPISEVSVFFSVSQE